MMGEHHLDKPYDVICDEILAERARLKAEQETAELRCGPAGREGQPGQRGRCASWLVEPAGGPGGTRGHVVASSFWKVLPSDLGGPLSLTMPPRRLSCIPIGTLWMRFPVTLGFPNIEQEQHSCGSE